MNISQYRYLSKRQLEISNSIKNMRLEIKQLEDELHFINKWKFEMNPHGSSVDMVLAKEHHHSIVDIQNIVCTFFTISIADLISNKRSKSLVLPRHIAMFLCREYTDYSLPEIAESFGNRDHTSIIHAVRKISDLIIKDSEIREYVNNLRENVNEKIKNS